MVEIEKGTTLESLSVSKEFKDVREQLRRQMEEEIESIRKGLVNELNCLYEQTLNCIEDWMNGIDLSDISDCSFSDVNSDAAAGDDDPGSNGSKTLEERIDELHNNCEEGERVHLGGIAIPGKTYRPNSKTVY